MVKDKHTKTGYNKINIMAECKVDNLTMDKVFASDIQRGGKNIQNDLRELLQVSIAKPIIPLITDSENESDCEFKPKNDKEFIRKKKPMTKFTKVVTVKDVRSEIEKTMLDYLPAELEKKEKYLYRKICNGSIDATTASKMLKTSDPLSKNTFQMITNLNPEKKHHRLQFVFWNGKNIKVNGSTGGDKKFIVNFDLGKEKVISKEQVVQAKQSQNKNLIQKSLSIKFKPGPLSTKKKLDYSHQKYNVGPTELIRLPKIALEVEPQIGKSIEPTISHVLHSQREKNGLLTQNWAEFAVSTLTSSNNKEDDQNEPTVITFNLNYRNDQNVVLMRNDTNSDVAKCIEVNIHKETITNFPDLENEVNSILNDIINCVEINLCQNDLYSEEPNTTLEIQNSDCAGEKYTFLQSKDKIKRKYGELAKLDVTVIKLNHANKQNLSENCNESHCRLGCVCASLESDLKLKNHCGRLECMFNCTCDFSRFKSNGKLDPKISDLLPGIINYDSKINSTLAKEEQKFHQTVVLTDDKSIVLKSQRQMNRIAKAPKRYAEYMETAAIQQEELETPQKTTLRYLSIPLMKLPCRNIEPWCMVHNLYKCFCKGRFAETALKDIPDVKDYIDVDENEIRKRKGSDEYETKSKRIRNENDKPDEIYPIICPVLLKPCSRVRKYRGRRFSEGYYKETHGKIKDMEENDKKLQERLLKLLKKSFYEKNEYDLLESASSESSKQSPVKATNLPTLQNTDEKYISRTDFTNIIQYEQLPFTASISSSASTSATAPTTSSAPTFATAPTASAAYESATGLPASTASTFASVQTASSAPTSLTVPSASTAPTSLTVPSASTAPTALTVPSASTAHTSSTALTYSTAPALSTASTSLRQGNTHPNKMKLRAWLEANYKFYKNRLQSKNKPIPLEAPKLGKVALYPWEVILDRFNQNKNFFLVTREEPYRTFMAVDLKNPFLENCINIEDISIDDVGKYPVTVKNLLQNVSYLKDNFYILLGMVHCWELIGSVTKIREKSDSESETQTTIESPILAEPPITEPGELYESPKTSIELPTERNAEFSKWFVMTVENDFTEIQFNNKGFFVKYENISKAINVARCSGKTVRLSSQKFASDEAPQFGLYAIPNTEQTCVFVGPYEKDEKLGIITVKKTFSQEHMKTRGFWITTKKKDDYKVIDNPMSFLPKNELSIKEVTVPNSTDTEPKQDMDDIENINKEPPLNVKNPINYVKLVKPIKITKNNGFFQLAQDGVLKSVSLLKAPPKVAAEDIPFIAPASSLPHTVTPIIKDTFSLSTCFDKNKYQKPVAEIAPQIKASSSSSPAQESKGMLILKPAEINKKLTDQLNSGTFIKSDIISSDIDDNAHMDVERFLCTNDICQPPPEDVFVISDDEDGGENQSANVNNDLIDLKTFENVWIECKDAGLNLGYINGRRNNANEIGFEFPGFKFTDFYPEEEAFNKINQVLSRKIYIPKDIEIEWRVVDKKENLMNPTIMTDELINPEMFLTKLRSNKADTFEELKVGLRELRDTLKSCSGAEFPNETPIMMIDGATSLIGDLERSCSKLENEKDSLQMDACIKKSRLLNLLLHAPDDLRKETTERMRAFLKFD